MPPEAHILGGVVVEFGSGVIQILRMATYVAELSSGWRWVATLRVMVGRSSSGEIGMSRRRRCVLCCRQVLYSTVWYVQDVPGTGRIFVSKYPHLACVMQRGSDEIAAVVPVVCRVCCRLFVVWAARDFLPPWFRLDGGLIGRVR